MKTIKKTWTWASVGYFNNYFGSYEVGDEFTIENDLIHTPIRGDIIEIVEFDMDRFKEADRRKRSAITFKTGRSMIVECLQKDPNGYTMQWGMPFCYKAGAARFRILEKRYKNY